MRGLLLQANTGREVSRDDNNNVDVQMQRLVLLWHLAQREIEAGWQLQDVKFHDFFNALARAKMGKKLGSDGVVVEMACSQLVSSPVVGALRNATRSVFVQ